MVVILGKNSSLACSISTLSRLYVEWSEVIRMEFGPKFNSTDSKVSSTTEQSRKSIYQKKAYLKQLQVQQTLDILPHLIWVSIGNSGSGYFNRAWQNYLNLEETDIGNMAWLKYMHPDDLEHVYSLWEKAQQTGQSFERECRLRHHSGEYRWFLMMVCYQLLDGQDQWYVTCTDIHQRVTEYYETAESLRAHTDMLDVSVDCIKIVRPDGTVSHMNKSGCVALLGKERIKKFDMPWLSLLPKEVRAKGQRAINDAGRGKNARFPGMSVSGNKTQYWDNILTPVVNEEGQVLNILCVSRDITLQRVAEKRLRIASELDELTGLPNRRSFRAKLSRLMMRVREGKRSIGLMLIDLDHFKHVNDTLGHAAGDHLLKVLSKRLIANASENTFISRLGGDEFAIIFDKMTDDQAFLAEAENIRKQMDIPITYMGKVINGGMTIGCARAPYDTKDSSDLMKYADTALGYLKDSGRGGICMFNASMLEGAQKSADQLSCAHQIIRDDLIQPYYQPQLRLQDGKLIGFEALLRWNSAEGLQMPETVAEAFNNYELATKISDAMQTKVFADMARWISQGINVVPVSINAAPVEFLRDDYAERLLKRLEESNIPPSLICVEVTEHVLGERGSEFVVRALKKLTKAGTKVALDDFGTGHSSLAHLRDYPVNSLKIDRSFVKCIDQDPQILAIVKAIGQLGPSLSLDIIAEGIETVAQRETLLDAGCSLGQGFLFSKAIAADEVEDILVNTIYFKR